MDRRLARGDRIDRFEIEGVLGEGGMGTTYAALDPQLGRTIALKLVRDDKADAAAQLRLVREAQTLAKLSHPNVLTVFEAGAHSKQVWIALEYARGGTLLEWQKQPHRWREILPLYVAAGEGLAAAHTAGVIHRDFKPDNVLLDGDGHPLVADFGLARSYEMREGGADLEKPVGLAISREGVIAGTAHYMSPEQHFGRAADVRSDQYSFCAALWEALFGTLPFDAADSMLLVSRIARREWTRPRERRGVPRWLEAVMRRGLELDPDARWPSMHALLDELREAPARRRRRWIGGVAFATIAAASTVTLVASRRVHREEVRADQATNAYADELHIAEARRMLTIDAGAAVREIAKLSRGSPRWSEARWILAEAATRGISRTFAAESRVDTLAFSRDGSALAGGTERGDVYVWDVATGRRTELRGPQHAIVDVAFTEKTHVVAVTAMRGVWEWDVPTATVRELRPANSALASAAFSPDGAHLAIFSERGELVSLATNEVRALPALRRGAWKPDGRAIVAFDRANWRIVQIDATTLEARTLDESSIDAQSIASDGDRVLLGDVRANLFVVRAGERTRIATGRSGAITAIAVGADRTLALGGMASRYIGGGVPTDTTVSIVRGLDREVLRGHTGEVTAVAISPGAQVASAGRDGVRVWERRGVRHHGEEPATAAAMIDGELVFAGRGPTLRRDRTLAILDAPPSSTTTVTRIVGGAGAVLTLDSAKHLVRWTTDGGRAIAEDIVAAATDPREPRFATATARGTLQEWRGDPPIATVLDDSIAMSSLAYSHDGRLAIGGRGGAAVIDGAARYALDASPTDMMHVVAFSPDGRTLAAGSSRDVYAWTLADAHTSTSLGGRRWSAHEAVVNQLAFSHDGRTLLSGDSSGLVVRWDIASGRGDVLRGHAGPIATIAFRDDDRIAITASADGTARLWDLASNTSRVLPCADAAVFAGFRGRVAFVVDRSGTVVEDSDDLPTSEAELRAWIARALGVR